MFKYFDVRMEDSWFTVAGVIVFILLLLETTLRMRLEVNITIFNSIPEITISVYSVSLSVMTVGRFLAVLMMVVCMFMTEALPSKPVGYRKSG